MTRPMTSLDDHPLLGEWHQAEPDPTPASIAIRFDSDGRFTYTIDAHSLALTWRMEGDTLITSVPNGPGEQVHHYRIATSPTRLILGTHVYERG